MNNTHGKELFGRECESHAHALGLPWLGEHRLLVQVVEYAKTEVLADVAAGDVPATVATYAELHDHVDANKYGGAFDWPSLVSDHEDDDEYLDAHCSFWNRVQDAADEWIRAGGVNKGK